jgi:hypothetical protein
MEADTTVGSAFPAPVDPRSFAFYTPTQMG